MQGVREASGNAKILIKRALGVGKCHAGSLRSFRQCKNLDYEGLGRGNAPCREFEELPVMQKS